MASIFYKKIIISKHTLLSFLLIIICIITNISYAENSLYTVPLACFNEKVYSEKTTKYRIKSSGKYILPDTPYQKVLDTDQSGSNITIIIKTGDIENNTVTVKNEYLSDSRLLNLANDEKSEFKFRFKDSKSIIYDVENYVYNHISKKTIGIPIISAGEILRRRTGDCTEHTVLAVSILRTLGIPTRALIGMILSEEFENNKNIFIYHMWAEAFVNGEWILVDATRPDEKHANRYIALAYHHLKTEMPLSYLKAVSAMKSFTIEYLD